MNSFRLERVLIQNSFVLSSFISSCSSVLFALNTPTPTRMKDGGTTLSSARMASEFTLGDPASSTRARGPMVESMVTECRLTPRAIDTKAVGKMANGTDMASSYDRMWAGLMKVVLRPVKSMDMREFTGSPRFPRL